MRQSTGKRVRLTDRDLLWLEKLHQHGPLSTSYLLAYSAVLRTSDKRQKERLGDLFHEENTAHGGAYIDRAPQQFATLKAGYNQIVHQVSATGVRALKEKNLWHQTSGHHGPWLHRHMVACSTASVELATLQRSNLSFIPQHAILERAGAGLSFPLRIQEKDSDRPVRKDLKPDALFGLTYHTTKGDRFRFFAMEVDRGTEPVTSRNWNRKSFERHLKQYEMFVAQDAYKEMLKLTAPLLVLDIVPDRDRMNLMLKQTKRQLGPCSYQLFQTFEDFAAPWRPPEPNHALLESAWSRVGYSDFLIGDV
ncbi:replication-relaxation family protein [Roseovarius rhodophyticola]|uniref:Replication-relaxation family protein n=1 Tax=Roseovarius rhodophyticola TaxID=3080827 RepID=A0ABZ2TKJ3_9RHOB|nr:replication-relaxation family protein [Roseovarius sp. W115]MDV2930175.1 replication-relaxation family protein [Roseovarius sp. W115]